VTPETGIRFVHCDGSSGARYIVETISAGLALWDYDQDGDQDLYFLNGAPLPGWQGDPPPRNALWRNEGDWTFTDVTDVSGLGDTGFGLGVAVGDFDEDGDADVFVNNYGPNALYANNGDGTFAKVTVAAAIDPADEVGAGACFLDADADGDLDLYVANYVDFNYENHVLREVEGYPQYAGPRDYRAVPDTLYRNNGDGSFTDISRESGIAASAGTSMGLVTADYDRDGDTDLFVLNDVAGNFLFRNDGHGYFEEVGLTSGFAYNGYGDELGSMGVDCGDYDNDGWLDLFMTSYQTESPVLYRNVGPQGFEDMTLQSQAGTNVVPYVNWGNGLIDFDNDGDRDLFIANGHLQDNIDELDQTTAYRARNSLLMNIGSGNFLDVTVEAGSGLEPRRSSRGAAFDDLDGDGLVDAVILNSREKPTILRNETQTPNHWLRVALVGRRTNRSAIGAQVTIHCGDTRQVAEVHSGRGYQSHYGTELMFGLGSHDCVDRLEVRWIGGGRDVLEQVEANQKIVVLEGR
jgi:hypothetical protein